MLVTSDPTFAATARSIANQGRLEGRNFFEHHHLGTNFRLTAWQAAVLMAQMERLDEQIERRTARAGLLKALLADKPRIDWQTEPAAVTRNPQYLLLGRLRGGRAERDALCDALDTAGIPCTPFYPHTLPQNPLYEKQNNCRVLPCPNAEACVEDAFWLSHRVLLADESTIEEVADVMRRAFGEPVRQIAISG